jgi:hypothetical protein
MHMCACVRARAYADNIFDYSCFHLSLTCVMKSVLYDNISILYQLSVNVYFMIVLGYKTKLILFNMGMEHGHFS